MCSHTATREAVVTGILFIVLSHILQYTDVKYFNIQFKLKSILSNYNQLYRQLNHQSSSINYFNNSCILMEKELLPIKTYVNTQRQGRGL